MVSRRSHRPRRGKSGNAAANRDIHRLRATDFSSRSRQPYRTATRWIVVPTAAVRFPSVCQASARRSAANREITETPTIVTEHRGLAHWCPHCQKFHCPAVAGRRGQGGALRPTLDGLGRLYEGRLPCLVLYHPQVSPRVGPQVDVSWRLFGQAGCQGEPRRWPQPISELLGAAPAAEAVLNIDETGHKEYREKFWT